MTTIKDGYYRVTEVLDVFSKLHMIDKDVLENAQIRGNKVDAACKCLMVGVEPFHLEDQYQKYLDSFRIWMEGKVFPEQPERFYDDELNLTGECDGIYNSDGGLVLFDLKTPENEGRSWPLQGSAYTYLARKYGYDIKKIEFVKLSKEGKEPKVYIYDFEPNWELYKKALELYDYFFKKKKMGNKRPSTTVIEGLTQLNKQNENY